ncbi:MAG: M48 family metallopeptidase [Bryobacteraceae bacterium]
MCKSRKYLLPAASVMLLVLPAAAARKPGEEIKPGFNLFSKQQDVQLGLEASSEIRKQYQVVNSPELQEYITRVGKKLAAQKEAGDYPYTFTLVSDKSINAFALPGGPTFIHTGLITSADNEAQVAGVLAHEIAHVALRHGTNQASKANLMQIPAVLAGAVTGSGLLAQLTQIGATGFMLRFSRSAETQADLLGARIMSQGGYNPIEMARFFEKLETAGGSRAPQFLSDHPNPGNRVKAVQEEIAGLPRTSYTASAGDFTRVKAQISQLPPPPAKSKASNVAPGQQEAPTIRGSEKFKQVKGQHFALSYPDNWEVLGDQNSATLTLAPREGVVNGPGGTSAIGYGVIVSYFFPETKPKNLQEATDQLIQHMHGSNPSMEVVARDKRKLKVDGSNALSTTLSSNSPYRNQKETDLLVTVDRPEGVFYAVFIAPQRDFQNLQGTFDEMVRSIRFTN